MLTLTTWAIKSPSCEGAKCPSLAASGCSQRMARLWWSWLSRSHVFGSRRRKDSIRHCQLRMPRLLLHHATNSVITCSFPVPAANSKAVLLDWPTVAAAISAETCSIGFSLPSLWFQLKSWNLECTHSMLRTEWLVPTNKLDFPFFPVDAWR